MIGVLFASLFIVGCENKKVTKAVSVDDSKPQTIQGNTSDKQSCIVDLVGTDKFPAFIAKGVWRNRKTGWEFAFNKDGSLKWIQYDMGKVIIKPLETVEVPMKMDKTSTYKAGEWTISYDATTQELAVIINIDSYHLEIGDSVVDGHSKDIFVGEISEDGTWNAYWTSYKHSVAKIPGQKPREIPNDPIYGKYQDLVLTQGDVVYKTYKVDY